MNPAFRTFVALDLSEEIRKELRALILPLKRHGRDIRFVDPDHMHLTLKFLGNITEDQKDQVIEVLEGIGRDQTPFELRLKGLGVFPNWSRPRVLWVGVEQGLDQVKSLAAIVHDYLGQKGFGGDDRPFAAHITLGRVKHLPLTKPLADEIKKSLEFSTPSMNIKSIAFYRSHLSEAGARHELLSEFVFKGGSTPCP